MLKKLKHGVCLAAIDAVAAASPSGTFGYGAFFPIAASLLRLAAASTLRLAANYRRDHASHSHK
jgi:hypothetical protein